MAVLLIGASTTMALSGCAGPPGVADRTYRGLPTSPALPEPADPLPEEPMASWLEDSNRIALVTWGSSACPRVVTAIEARDASTVQLTLEPSGREVCTADMSPTTHELTLPDDATGRPLTLLLTYTDWPEATELTLE
ncbi:hypothetical protein [Microbacterium album]|uniref:Uncharacterized protein n=1 Tax=Microbacterium album TaxID=2053191 RepID=A0A917MNY1_9MICO|nr:hypothetical protein [Microbacterium album]GGH50999.1 hypothetical protein GCM10010921_30160 [Microbacterium album]